MDSIDTPMEKGVEIRGVFATQGDQDEVGERDVGGEVPIFLDEACREGRRGCQTPRTDRSELESRDLGLSYVQELDLPLGEPNIHTLSKHAEE